MLINLEINPEEYYYPRKMESILSDVNETGEWEKIKDLKYKDVSEKLIDGVYKFWDVNGDDLIEQSGSKILSPYPWQPKALKELINNPDNFKSPYGICDNHEQVLEEYKNFINVPDRKFVIIMCPIEKKNEPRKDGWRWEKWGEYIGTQNSQADYIYDSPEIELVYVYHIYEIF